LSSPYSQLIQTENEKYYYDCKAELREKFPSILSTPSKYLSVIVPSYNEEERLPTMLDEAFDYLEMRTKKDSSFSYEIIVVDDGSKDKTTEVALKYNRKYSSDKLRVLKLDQNRGKGGAVQMGVMKSRGGLILFADADGATRFSDFEKMEKYVKDSSFEVTLNLNRYFV
jgi:dolichyl-phosphate beta-glucosyltransferase